MIVFCLHCWAKNRSEAEQCIHCGQPLAGVKSYDEALIAALAHPEAETPVRAATILGERQVSAAVEPLREILRQSDDPFLLEAACIALGQIGDPAAEPELVLVARQGPFLGRRAALTALSKLGTASSWYAIALATQNDPSVLVKATAQQLLNGHSGASAVGD